MGGVLEVKDSRNFFNSRLTLFKVNYLVIDGEEGQRYLKESNHCMQIVDMKGAA